MRHRRQKIAAAGKKLPPSVNHPYRSRRKAAFGAFGTAFASLLAV
jgi:hypothetical protein